MICTVNRIKLITSTYASVSRKYKRTRSPYSVCFWHYLLLTAQTQPVRSGVPGLNGLDEICNSESPSNLQFQMFGQKSIGSMSQGPPKRSICKVRTLSTRKSSAFELFSMDIFGEKIHVPVAWLDQRPPAIFGLLQQ